MSRKQDSPKHSSEDVTQTAAGRRRDRSGGLCFRCEHRAMFLERGMQPRCECGDVEGTVCSCYMYKPVRPVLLDRNEGDDRPRFAGAMIAARERCVGVAERDVDIELGLVERNGRAMLYWKPGQDGENEKPDA